MFYKLSNFSVAVCTVSALTPHRLCQAIYFCKLLLAVIIQQECKENLEKLCKWVSAHQELNKTHFFVALKLMDSFNYVKHL